MLEAGRACLILALAICVYGIGASLYGARTGRRQWVASGRRAADALAGVLVLAFAILESGFIRSDFAFALVARRGTPTNALPFNEHAFDVSTSHAQIADFEHHAATVPR